MLSSVLCLVLSFPIGNSLSTPLEDNSEADDNKKK